MHTEEEAHELWCPMARVLSHTSAQDGKGRLFEGGYSWNRAPNTFDPHSEDEPPYTPRSANCIGSKCAMWRWGGSKAFAIYPSGDEEEWSLAGWGGIDRMREHNPKLKFREEKHGFCGLAGGAA